MRYLLIFLFSFTAQAKDCFLSYDKSQKLFVDCRIGAKPPEYTRVCRMVDGERDGSVYKVEIVKERLILPDLRRDWSIGAVLEDGEQIECSIDPALVRARADAIAAREAAEQARKDASQARRANARSACQAAQAGPIKQLCRAVFDEDF